MIRLTLAVDESTWKQLRLLAEVNRTRGRASVADVVRQAVRQLVAQTPHGAITKNRRTSPGR